MVPINCGFYALPYCQMSRSSIKLRLCLLDGKMQDCDDKIDLLKPHIAKEKQEALSRDMMAAEMSI